MKVFLFAALVLFWIVSGTQTGLKKQFKVCILNDTIPENLDIESVHMVLNRVFRYYSPYTNLTYSQDCKDANVDILFHANRHSQGDFKPCDEFRKILVVPAHTTDIPNPQIHLNKDVTFTFGRSTNVARKESDPLLNWQKWMLPVEVMREEKWEYSIYCVLLQQFKYVMGLEKTTHYSIMYNDVDKLECHLTDLEKKSLVDKWMGNLNNV